MKSPTSDSEHVYELKKMKMSQDKDGYLVVFRLHHTDHDTDVVRKPVGAVFSGTMKFENYVEVT
jgi:hypothetical protein